MYVGALELDLLLGEVGSIKQKRSVVRPVVAELKRRYAVSVAEAGPSRPAPPRPDRGRGGGGRPRARHRRARPLRAPGGRPPRVPGALRADPLAGPARRLTHPRGLRPREPPTTPLEDAMADAPRARRLAKRISQIVASTLEHEVKDPRLAMVTITDTRITPDLRDATVYYTVYGGEQERTGSAAALASAKGVLRTRRRAPDRGAVHADPRVRPRRDPRGRRPPRRGARGRPPGRRRGRDARRRRLLRRRGRPVPQAPRGRRRRGRPRRRPGRRRGAVRGAGRAG